MADAPKQESAKAAPAAKAEDKEPSALEKAQKNAPHLDAAFVKQHGLSDEYLEAVAAGTEPPPPYNGPEPTTDLHYTDGGWQQTPKGVAPEDVGKDAISR